MGTSLVVQQLRVHASNAEGMGLIPGWGTKIPQAEQWGQKKREREKENKLNAQQQGMASQSQPLMLWDSMYNSGQLNWASLHTKGASLRYRSGSGQHAQQARQRRGEGRELLND